jgi:hypothetical protein
VWRLRLGWVSALAVLLSAAVQCPCHDEDAEDDYNQGPEIKFYAIRLQKKTQTNQHDDYPYYDAYDHAAVWQAEAFVLHLAVVFSVASRVTLADGVEWSAAVGAVDVGVGVLSATSAAINHKCSPLFKRGVDLVLRFAVARILDSQQPRFINFGKWFKHEGLSESFNTLLLT